MKTVCRALGLARDNVHEKAEKCIGPLGCRSAQDFFKES
jgi:hypothetical protein